MGVSRQASKIVLAYTKAYLSHVGDWVGEGLVEVLV
jgi:hypothetical protein